MTETQNTAILKYDCIPNWGVSKMNDVIYYFADGLYSQKGVYIDYPDGTTRFISNSWYVDINTDNL